jgi:hypothetical protein
VDASRRRRRIARVDCRPKPRVSIAQLSVTHTRVGARCRLSDRRERGWRSRRRLSGRPLGRRRPLRGRRTKRRRVAAGPSRRRSPRRAPRRAPRNERPAPPRMPARRPPTERAERAASTTPAESRRSLRFSAVAALSIFGRASSGRTISDPGSVADRNSELTSRPSPSLSTRTSRSQSSGTRRRRAHGDRSAGSLRRTPVSLR